MKKFAIVGLAFGVLSGTVAVAEEEIHGTGAPGA
jgi:hypothetical protein